MSSIQWTVQDDTNVIWIMLCCPFSEFKRLLPALQGRKPSSVGARFLEIINSEELLQRICSAHNDLIGYKTVPWTQHELLSLVRLIHNNKKCNQVQFLQKFPMLFHPSRTASSLNAANVRLKTKEQASLEHQLQTFRECMKGISNEVKGHELCEFPGSANYLEEIERALNIDTSVTDKKAVAADENIESIRRRAAEKMTKRTFAALVGPGNIRLIEKCRVVVGRRSPKCTPDIDLSDLKLQGVSRLHCAISFATDLHFYLEVLSNTVIVNGVPLERGKFARLSDCDLIDVGGACFIFLENQSLIPQLRSA